MAAKHTGISIEQYLNERSREVRMGMLRDWKSHQVQFPLNLVQDLLLLDLSSHEKAALLEIAGSEHSDQLEEFLIHGACHWQQELAAPALRTWALKTGRKHHPKVTKLLSASHTSQRVRYTILDIAWESGGLSYIAPFATMDGLEDFSPALHALVLQRALQWNFDHERLKKLAISKIQRNSEQPLPDDKSFVVAIEYLLRFDANKLHALEKELLASGPWRDAVRGLLLVASMSLRLQEEACHKIEAMSPQTAWNTFLAEWPSIWTRSDLSSKAVSMALRIAKHSKVDPEKCWTFFGGVPESTLNQALQSLNGKDLDFSKSLLGSLITDSQGTNLGTASSKILSDRVDADKRHQHFCARLEKVLSNPASNDGIWALLTQSWHNPSESHLNQLATIARQEPYLYRLAYIQTLGRFKGVDQAALKLLDFIRTPEEDELRACVRALDGINTPRANQELIHAITRANATYPIQLEVSSLLKEKDLSHLQSEIHSSIDDLKNSGLSETSWEVRESLAELLDTPASAVAKSGGADQGADQKNVAKMDSQSSPDLDSVLIAKIPRFKDLSSEVRRALRTAQFFDLQVNRGGLTTSIDLSPVIDMQYKAMELTFREFFEDICTRVLQQGIVQRKLDVIGYARPIPPAMDEFEQHLAALPTVREIQFFSKFKLRKMLRAICQYEPGKRFTLDGLKAFGLFFLCFGRKRCKYGLQNLFPMPQMTDDDVALFCKQLHTFQDFRNRAAHEGFHPEAAGDIEGIWKSTAAIIDQAWKLKEALKSFHPDQSSSSGHRPQNNGPIIQKKVG